MDPSEFTASLRPTFSPTSPFSDLISDGRERELCFTHFLVIRQLKRTHHKMTSVKWLHQNIRYPEKKKKTQQEAERLKFKFSNPVVWLMGMWTGWDWVLASSILTSDLQISCPLPLNLRSPVPLRCWRPASKPFISEQRDITWALPWSRCV